MTLTGHDFRNTILTMGSSQLFYYKDSKCWEHSFESVLYHEFLSYFSTGLFFYSVLVTGEATELQIINFEPSKHNYLSIAYIKNI